MAEPKQFLVATEEEFDEFVQKATSEEDWRVVIDQPELKVWEQTVEDFSHRNSSHSPTSLLLTC